jgi:hypothetical protein
MQRGVGVAGSGVGLLNGKTTKKSQILQGQTTKRNPIVLVEGGGVLFTRRGLRI